MEKILLTDLPGRKDLIGKRVNVRRQGGLYHYDYQDKPMMRIFLGAKKYKETHKGKSSNWVQWEWKPEPKGLAYDCGYSGVGIDGDLFSTSYLEV